MAVELIRTSRGPVAMTRNPICLWGLVARGMTEEARLSGRRGEHGVVAVDAQRKPIVSRDTGSPC